jgi:hypothetical protein
MPFDRMLSRKEAISFLNINEKNFDNYFKASKEIPSEKIRGRFYFKESDLHEWDNLRKARTVALSIKEYEKCFEFAVKMVYASNSSHGTGIRGARSEMQHADDFILGILAEHGLQKFLSEKFNLQTEIDIEVHPDHITPQDITSVKMKGVWREPNLGIAVKSSKIKSCFNILPELEYENQNRRSDVYIFIRVDLPSDHLFRILRDHSFFKNVKEFLDESDGFRKIEVLKEINIWITGFNWHDELDKVKSIPGLRFENGYRYVKSVSEMHNTDDDWRKLISKI